MRKSQHYGKILLLFIDYNLTNVTKLDHKTLFPSNFEKQKLYLVVNVFNEKTCVALVQMEMEGTTIFVENVTKMWNAVRNLNDQDRASKRPT